MNRFLFAFPLLLPIFPPGGMSLGDVDIKSGRCRTKSSSGDPPNPGDCGIPSISGEGIEPGVEPRPDENGLSPGDIIRDLPPAMDGADMDLSIIGPTGLPGAVFSLGLPGPLLSPLGRGPLKAHGPGACILNGIRNPGGYSDPGI